MKTDATAELPAIEWDPDKLMERDSEERMQVWSMIGIGTNGLHYSGTGYFFCGELDSIKDIELDD